jgi:hypothetical protein
MVQDASHRCEQKLVVGKQQFKASEHLSLAESIRLPGQANRVPGLRCTRRTGSGRPGQRHVTDFDQLPGLALPILRLRSPQPDSATALLASAVTPSTAAARLAAWEYPLLIGRCREFHF